MKPSPSNSLAKYVILNCNLNGHYVWRNNTVGVAGRSNVAHKGVGDVIGITKNGQHIEFEIKIGKDKQSDSQLHHEAMIKKNNGLYFVVKTIEDVDNLVKGKKI